MIMWLYVDYVNWKSQYQHNEFFLICPSFTCVYIIEKDFKTCRHSHKHTVFPLLVETCSSSMPPLCTITLYGFHTGVMQSWSCSKNAFNTTEIANHLLRRDANCQLRSWNSPLKSICWYHLYIKVIPPTHKASDVVQFCLDFKDPQQKIKRFTYHWYCFRSIPITIFHTKSYSSNSRSQFFRKSSLSFGALDSERIPIRWLFEIMIKVRFQLIIP